MKLIFIRHGEPDYVKDSLTEKGFREAALLAKRAAAWQVKDVYCSPLGRARDTAAPSLAAWGKEAAVHDWLMEFPGWIVNPFDGRKRIPWDFMPNYWTREPLYFDREHWIDAPLMQTGDVKEKWEEAIRGLDGILAAHGYERENDWYRVREGNEDTLVFFCHLGISCVLIAHLIGVSPMILWHGVFMPPSCVNILQTEEREEGKASFRIRALADTAHLFAAGEPISEMGAFEEKYGQK